MALTELFTADLATTTVTSGGTDAPASGTPETWTVASSAMFGAATTSVSQFHVADPATGKGTEIIAVTNVSGTTWTVTRGAESTTPVTHLAGFTVYQVGTAAFLATLPAGNLPAATSGAQGAIQLAGDLGNTAAAPEVLSTHLSAPLPLAQGGTGQATQQAAMDALAGATTSGDYLRGNGSHAVMAALQAGDLPAASTSTQGAVILDGTATDIQPIGVQAAGAKGQAADAKHVHPYQPWQFLPETYGALGNGKIGTGGTGTSGTKAFSDSGAHFTSADIGKYIIVNQGTGGGNTNPLTSTITAVGSSTSVTLNDNLAANAASAPYIYGTDDAAAINACIAAAAAYAEANNQKAQVIFGDKFYMLGAITQTTSPVRYNTHIPLPFANATAPKLIMDLTGTGFSPGIQFWEGEIPLVAGTTLVSAITPPAQPDGTYGQFSIIGTPNDGSGQAGNFCNALYTMDGITLCAPWNTFAVGFDGIYLSQMSVPTGRALAFAPVNYSGGTVGGPWMNTSNFPTNDVAVGFRFPTWLNNAFNYTNYLICEGWSIGIDAAEHFEAQFLQTLYCDRGLQISSTSQTVSHGLTIQHFSCEDVNYAVYVNSGGNNTIAPLNIGLLDMESILTAHVEDVNNNLSGTIYWNNLTANYAVVNGGANLIVIDVGKHYPGPWSGAPAVPASTVAQQNLAYRYATVYITSGGAAVSAIAVDGTATGLTLGSSGTVTVRVPPGHTITLTYASTAPTWKWVLD